VETLFEGKGGRATKKVEGGVTQAKDAHKRGSGRMG
jgi:hypothetical protein